MEFWLDRVIRRSRISYPIFFGLIAFFLYLLGIPFMIMTDNLQAFLSDPKGVLLAVFGAYNGVLVIFVFRKFSDSLDKIKHLIDSEDEFETIKDRLLGRLTSKVYWIPVAFWLFMNSLIFSETVQRWYWQSLYNKPQLVSAYYFLDSFPYMIFIGIFFYMILVGLTMAYRDLCTRIPFNEEVLLAEWMEPFKGFKKFITLIMFGAAVYAVFPTNIWGSVPEPTAATHLVTFSMRAPYFGVIGLLSAILFPHYYFNKLFSKTKENRLRYFRGELSKIPTRKVDDIIRRTNLLLEKGEVEKMKTWLIDLKILGEILVVALMHLILVEAFTTFIHG